MSIPYTSGDFTSARANGESWVEYPFIEYGDNTTKVYHLVCEVNEVDYAPITLDTTMASASNADVISLPFTADAAAYHVGDFGKAKIDGGLTRFDRQFANIPQPTVDPAGSEIFTFPGLPSTAGVGSKIVINSASVSSGVITLNLASAHGMTTGDNFTFYIKGYTAINGRNYYSSYRGNSECITGTAGSIIKLYTYFPNGFTFTYGYVWPFASRGRQQVSRKSSTQFEYDYFLPGVSAGITTSQEISLPQRFEPYLYTEGNSVQSLNSGTTPTNIEYNEIVNSDGFLVLDSGVERWKGNIVRRTVKSIRAI
jgi:hypothetical protein